MQLEVLIYQRLVHAASVAFVIAGTRDWGCDPKKSIPTARLTLVVPYLPKHQIPAYWTYKALFLAGVCAVFTRYEKPQFFCLSLSAPIGRSTTISCIPLPSEPWAALIFRHAFLFFFFFPALLYCFVFPIKGIRPQVQITHLGDAAENWAFVSVWRMLSLTCQRTYFTWWERMRGQIPLYCKQADRGGLTLGMSMAYFVWWKVS